MASNKIYYNPLLFIATVLGFLLLSIHLNAQTKDTILLRLERNVANATNDSVKIDALIRLGRYHIFRDVLPVEGYMLQVFELYDKNPDLLPHPDYARAHQQLGIVNRKRGNYPEALNYYMKTRDIFLSLGDSNSVANTYHNIAIVYRYQKEWDKALKFYHQAMDIKDKTNEYASQSITYTMLASCLINLQRYDSVLHYITKGRETAIKAKDSMRYYLANSQYANLLIAQKKYKEAIELTKKEVIYCKRTNRSDALINGHMRLCKAWYQLGEYDNAIKHIDSSLQLAKYLQVKPDLAEAYELRSEIWKKLGRHDKSLEDFKVYTTYMDSIYALEKTRELKSLELSYEFREQQLADSLAYAKERALLAKDIEKRKATRIRNYLIIAVLVVLLAVLYLFNRKRLQLARAEKALLNKELEESERKIENKEEAISNLIIESIQQIQSKKKLTENLKEVTQNNRSEISLKGIIAELNAENIEDDKLLLIREQLKSQNFEFHQQLKSAYPNLSSTDLEICSFIKMGLGRNEIARLRNTSVEAAKKSRYRLRKKMNLPDKIDFQSFLSSF